MIDIFIPGKPIGKGRPRVCRKVTYTPKPTKDYEKLVRQCYIAKYADKQPIPAKIPLKVSIIANYPIRAITFARLFVEYIQPYLTLD